jgi:hypothetical protein
MFHGRDQERQALSDMMGSALVYGGRQLGKSSLLRATERDFDDGHDRRALYLDVRKEQIGGVRPPSEIWLLLWRSLGELGIVPKVIPTGDPSEKLQSEVRKWLDARAGRAILVLMDECDAFLASDADNNFDTIDALEGFMADSGRRIKFVFAGLHRVQRFASVENHPLAHLGTPIAVGPLRSADAMKLVTRPMEVLGYRFEHPELPSRILAFCNNNPSLIVLFMHALLARMLEGKLQRVGTRRPPVIITDADVEATYTKESLAEQIKERFDLTIELDPAYKVIAYTVAHEARERGAGTEIPARQLRDMATGWWPRGFQTMSHDGFRSLCDELVDLGVLTRRSGSYALRSPNILRFLGSADQIMEVLIEAEHREPAVSFDAASARPRLGGDECARSPLTAAQLSDLVAAREQVRLVIGCSATGLDNVLSAVRESAQHNGVVVDTPAVATTQLRSFKNTSGRHRILVLDLRSVDGQRARTLLLEATRRPKADLGTVGIIFLTDGRHAELIRTADQEPDLQRVGFIEVRRIDKAAWRHWVGDAELGTSVADAEDILRSTGGWLSLLGPAARAVRDATSGNTRRALIDGLHTAVDEPAEASQLLDGVGLLRGDLCDAWSAICVEYPDGGPRADLELAIEVHTENPEPSATVELLRMLGALDAQGDRLVPEPTLARAQATAR